MVQCAAVVCDSQEKCDKCPTLSCDVPHFVNFQSEHFFTAPFKNSNVQKYYVYNLQFNSFAFLWYHKNFCCRLYTVQCL